jgi:hypothetical protein
VYVYGKGTLVKVQGFFVLKRTFTTTISLQSTHKDLNKYNHNSSTVGPFKAFTYKWK